MLKIFATRLPFRAHLKTVSSRRALHLLSGLILLAVLIGCERGGEKISNQTVDVASVLWGEDADKSGVRDDVEAWLTSSPYQGRERQALHFLASRYQAVLYHSTESFEAKKQMHQVVRALDCLTLTMGPEAAREARETLKRVQFNSPERIARYRTAQEHFAGEKIKSLESYADPKDVCPF